MHAECFLVFSARSVLTTVPSSHDVQPHRHTRAQLCHPLEGDWAVWLHLPSYSLFHSVFFRFVIELQGSLDDSERLRFDYSAERGMNVDDIRKTDLDCQQDHYREDHCLCQDRKVK